MREGKGETQIETREKENQTPPPKKKKKKKRETKTKQRDIRTPNEVRLQTSVTCVTYVGRNSTGSRGHQRNQRLSKTPPPLPAPKARIFFLSQEQRNVTGTFLKDIRSFHDFQKHLHKKHMDINVVLFLSYACGI